MGVFFECRTAYYTTLPNCTDSIVVDIGLTPDTEYYYRLHTPARKVYQQIFTTGNSGQFSIDTSVLPTELLNPWIGDFIFEIFQGDNCAKEKFTICDIEYDTIVMRFANIESSAAKIGCNC